MSEQETAIAVVEHSTGVLPVVSAGDAKTAMARYQELCQSVLDAKDYQEYGRGQKFKKKSAFRKLARFYGLSVEELPDSEKRVQLSGQNYAIQVSYRATANNGVSATGDGACDAEEKGERKYEWSTVNGRRVRGKLLEITMASYHVVRSNAHTRAFNRAVSNLVAMGEVSAEELNDDGPVYDSGDNHEAAKPPRQENKPNDDDLPFGNPVDDSIPGSPPRATEKQQKYLAALIENIPANDEKARKVASRVIDKGNDLTISEAKQAISWLKNRQDGGVR